MLYVRKSTCEVWTFRMGDYIPTRDVYETIHDGIRYDKLPFVYIKSTKNNTHASAYVGK